MGVNLSKGQQVSLTKRGGGGLSVVRMGLGWDAVKKRGLFGSRSQSIDLDASVQHTGDNLTGDGDGDDESIIVDLTRVPPAVSQIVFTVNSFTGQDFSQIE